MRNQSNNSNYFDDMDLWEEAATAPKQAWSKDTSRKPDPDLDNFYDEVADTSDVTRGTPASHTRRNRRRTHIFPVLLSLAVIALFLFVKPFSGVAGIPQPTSPDAVLPASPTAPINTFPSPEETAPAPTELPPSAVVSGDYRYFGRLLTEEQKAVYDLIRAGIACREDTVGPFFVKSEQELELIIQSVFFDWPEYFWFRSNYSGTYYDQETHLEYTLNLDYVFTKEEYAVHAAYVEDQTWDILQALQGKSDYEKVKGVYEYLIDRTVYNLDYSGTTIYDMFRDGQAVCEGYARATQYLLNKLGVEALYVHGEAGGYDQPRSEWGGHAWNIVNIDGIYYQLDTTWGDPLTEDGIQQKSFSYLNLTDEEMARRHDRKEWNSYPPCTDIRHNYYYIEGRYLESFSKDTITAWFRESYARGEALNFKCASESIYQSVCSWLFSEGGTDELFQGVLPEGRGYSYSYSYTDELYILYLKGL